MASHAQKFFQRRQKVSMGKTGDKRRASINDITSLIDYAPSFRDHAVTAPLPRSAASGPLTPRQLPLIIDNDQLSSFDWLHQVHSDGYALVARPSEGGDLPGVGRTIGFGDRMVIFKL